MAVLVRSGRTTIPGAATGAAAPPASRSRSRPTTPRWCASRRSLRCSTRLAIAVDADVADPADPALRRPGAGRRPARLAARRHRRLRRPGPGPRLRARERSASRRPRAARPRPSPDLLREALLDPGAPRRRAGAGGAPSDARWRWRDCCARSRDELADGATVEEVALGALGRHLLARAGCGLPPRGGGRRRPAGPPRPRRRRALCSTPRPGRRTSRSTPSRRDVPRTPCAPSRSRPTRWPSRGSATTPCGCSPPTAPRVSSGRSSWSPTCRRTPGPTCGAARTLLRADRIGVGGRLVAADHDPRAARRRAPALLRRLHPRPRAPGRDRRRVDRRRRRAAVALPDRALARRRRPSDRPRRRPAPASAVAGRPGRRAPAYDRRRRASPSRSATPPPPGWPGSPASTAPGRSRVPGADPATWWGTRAWTVGDQPLRPVDEPVVVSASALTSLIACPAQWFLDREAGAERATTPGAGLRQRRARARRPHRPRRRAGRRAPGRRRRRADDPRRRGLGPDPVPDALVGRTRARGGPARARPVPGQARARPARAAARHRGAAARPRSTCPTARACSCTGTPTGSSSTPTGRVVVVDLKTGKYPPTQAEIAEHPQLGLYQLAVENGAVEGTGSRRPGCRAVAAAQGGRRRAAGAAAGRRRSPTTTASARSTAS